MIPFLQLTPGADRAAIDVAIARVLDRGWFVLGPEVEAFEREFARAAGAHHGVGVGNGTDALAIALRAAGVNAGDEVITSPLTAAYTGLAILMAGARPVFADIDAQRLTLDPAAVEAAITPQTSAVVPVHLYGQPADMDALMAVAARHGLAVIEDCCQAHLATYRARPVGSFGAAAAYSFYPTKNLGALGDGGAVTTNDEQLASRARRLRNGGQSERYRHEEAGVNSRLDELQAAILRERLAVLPAATERRRSLAARYRRALSAANTIAVPPELDPGHVYHLFPVLVDDRTAFQRHMQASGVETLVHYPIPLTRQGAFGDAAPRSCPIAERVAGSVVSLPLYPSLADDVLDRVSEAALAFHHGRSAR